MDLTPSLHIEYRPLRELIPYARNSRSHSPSQVEQLAHSMLTFGFTNPVLVDGDSGVIAGHGRILALEKVWEEGAEILHAPHGMVPCIELGHLSDEQKRAYVIADNKHALNATWDGDMLKLEIEDLKAAGIDVGVLGFTPDELTVVLDGWGSDITRIERDGETLDGIVAVLRLQVSREDEPLARQVVTEALQSVSIAHEFK
jgi:ParB-like chromosome segregation protein Spo0J